VRNRELEFSLKDWSELIYKIEQTLVVEHALDNLSEGNYNGFSYFSFEEQLQPSSC
jgi:hypothetical protein